MKLGEAAVRRWPWLDDPPSDADSTGGYETIEIGREHFGGGPGGWSSGPDLRFYGPARGLWPLEVMLGAATATPGGNVDVREESCARYLCEVRPGDVASSDEVKLVDPPEADDDWRAIAADVCVDDRGLVRRIAWSPTTGKRHAPGLVERLATRVDRTPGADRKSASEGRLWTVTDLWDYGCQVDIRAPTDLLDPAGTPLREIGRDLWRMRREYKQRNRQAPIDP